MSKENQDSQEIKTEQLSISNPVPIVIKILRDFGFTTLFAIVAVVGIGFGVVFGFKYIKEQNDKQVAYIQAEKDKQDASILKKLREIKKSLAAKGCKIEEKDDDDSEESSPSH